MIRKAVLGCCLSAVLFAVCFGAPELPVVAHNKDALVKDVLVVRQNSKALGKTELYLSTDAARFWAPKVGLVVATRAPAWNAVLYSKPRNLGIPLSAAEVKGSGMGIFPCATATDNGKPQKYRDSLLRLDCTKVVSQYKGDPHVAVDTIMFQQRTEKILVESYLEFGSPCKLDPHIQTFLYYLFDQNKFQGIPLEQKNSYKDGSSDMPLVTMSIEHTSKLASFFDLPTGFKKAGDKLQLIMAPDCNDTLEDLWGTDAPAKTKKH